MTDSHQSVVYTSPSQGSWSQRITGFYLFIYLCLFLRLQAPSCLYEIFCGSAKDCDLALVLFTICTAKRWTLSSGHATSGSDPRLSELQIRAVALYARENMPFLQPPSCIPLDLNRVKLCAWLSIRSRPLLTRWQLLWMTFNPTPISAATGSDH